MEITTENVASFRRYMAEYHRDLLKLFAMWTPGEIWTDDVAGQVDVTRGGDGFPDSDAPPPTDSELRQAAAAWVTDELRKLEDAARNPELAEVDR